MLKYILKRIFYMAFILLGISLLTFSMLHLVPGDPAEIIAMERYGEEVTAEVVEHVRVELGLDQPLHIQYLVWLKNVMNGNLGYSSRTDRPVFDEIMMRFPATIELAIAGMFVSLFISILIGIISAIKQYSVLVSQQLSFETLYLTIQYILIHKH